VRLVSRSFLLVLLAALSACGDDRPPNAPTPPASVTVVAVEIEGPSQRDLGAAGQTLQLRALASLSDGSRSDVTNDAAWTVADARVLSVSSRGLVTAIRDGSTSVTATYRERAGSTGLRVAEELGPRSPVTGVVRDAERGTPIVGAYVLATQLTSGPIAGAVPPPGGRTDGNGFFDLGLLAGRIRLFVSHFGYDNAQLTVAALPQTMDIRLTPDTAPYIERRLTGQFDGVNDLGLFTSMVRISTRGSGVFDVAMRSAPCQPGQALSILAQNGGFWDLSTISDCDYARVRFVLRGSEVRLELQGVKPGSWELTYREPR
jgi:hypothetical protein